MQVHKAEKPPCGSDISNIYGDTLYPAKENKPFENLGSQVRINNLFYLIHVSALCIFSLLVNA